MKNSTDTIVAPATPPGRGGIAIVRLSGPEVKNIAQQLLHKVLQPRVATHTTFYDSDQKPIDEGIALFFSKPNSFTGEDVLELHGHGGSIVVNQLIQEILRHNARLAKPGEFSERAFLNGKIDLVQAEAIADLIDAASTQAARSALRSLQGEFSKKIHSIVEAVIQLRMYVEASIDFAEEEIDFLADQSIHTRLQKIIDEVMVLENSATQGSLLRDGITVVIAGQPNVGKSSLLNALSGKETAIVTDIPGTTRDVLRDYIVMDGIPLHIIDTAGLRDSHDIVEQEGIRRAHQEISQADLVLLVTDASRPETQQVDMKHFASWVLIRNKIDLVSEESTITTEKNHTTISLSVKNNQGIDLLRSHIKSVIGLHTEGSGNFSARRRHLDAIARAKQCLQTGLQQLTQHRAGELLAEDLRQAQQCLNEITGEFSSDDLLGRIFSSFCIGK